MARPDPALRAPKPLAAPVPPTPSLRPLPSHVDEQEHELAVRNRQFFDGYWRRGRQERDRLWRAWWHEAYEQLLTFAGPLNGKRVVNLFAGLGEDAAMLKERGAKVIAVDFSLPGLKQAAREASTPDNPRMLCADATQLPIASHSVDLVMAINGLCHTPKAEVLAEGRRLLKPGGKLLLLEVMRYPHLAMLARFLEPYRWRAPHKFLSVRELEELTKDFAFVRHQQYFVLSVFSAMLLRLPLGPKLFLPLHRLLIAADRPLLRWFPWLRHVSYLCVAEMRP